MYRTTTKEFDECPAYETARQRSAAADTWGHKHLEQEQESWMEPYMGWIQNSGKSSYFEELPWKELLQAHE